MTKTIAQHLGYGKEGRKWEKENRIYFLDDVLKNNPSTTCPRCESSEVKILRTHNVDGTDYACTECDLRYEIILSKRKEFL